MPTAIVSTRDSGHPKSVIPAKQAVSNSAWVRNGADAPYRHSRESLPSTPIGGGNPGVLEGRYSGVSPLHLAWIPAFQAVSKCPLSLWERVGVRATPTAQAAIDPLSLWERVGVREPRGKQAGVNGNEWERQGYWGPSPGLRPPSPRGRGVGFGTGRTGLRPPSPRGRGVGFGTRPGKRGWIWDGTGLRPSPRERGWIWDGSHRPSATLSQRERGFDTAWKAGMTISGVIASLGWSFDTAWKAGIQGWRGRGSAAGSQ